MAQNTNSTIVIDTWMNNPVTRAMLGAGGAGVSMPKNAEEQRIKLFYEELDRNNVFLTPELLQKEDFIYKFVVTSSAALRTRHTEKIQLFARLFANSICDEFADSESFEEMLEILDALDIFDLRILLLLKHFEDAHPHILQDAGTAKLENDAQRAMRFWNIFEQEAERQYGVARDVLSSMLQRLSRTGLYMLYSGLYLDVTPGQGALSPLFVELAKWLQSKNGILL